MLKKPILVLVWDIAHSVLIATSLTLQDKMSDKFELWPYCIFVLELLALEC